MEFTDQLQRKIKIPENPKRVISLVPSQTELLIDLGLEDHISGITKFCVHPEDLRKRKKIIGGTKSVHLERIKALQPDLILCNKEENTEKMVLELEKIAPVHVSDIVTLKGAFDLMQQYGQIFKKEVLVEKMISAVRNKKKEVERKVEGKRTKKVAYFIWKDPLMVAGNNTFINELLELNGFKNEFSGRYPETNLEELQNLDLDLILLSTEPYPFKEKHKKLFKDIEAEVLLVDGEFFSWYGSRLIKALDYFLTLQDHASISR
ncbi:ABC transporter substrate-binding protein [Autumnicola psychrophila]|uniref:Helical backbone metal receptor n=1 Tax=Autumnicola psychrophila TaxID=3075592 RepID=A0ABU3DTZ2_9FLAO|nr:helical backbone metal receptor [Zunongwangia sp. F225]MDT0686924.1 helical backbone metal receptor [Zunongwangia sp. F225]